MWRVACITDLALRKAIPMREHFVPLVRAVVGCAARRAAARLALRKPSALIIAMAAHSTQMMCVL
jgi:hypothetical protein